MCGRIPSRLREASSIADEVIEDVLVRGGLRNEIWKPILTYDGGFILFIA